MNDTTSRAIADTTTTTVATAAADRSPWALALMLASVAERDRTAPDATFANGAVRGAARVLHERLGTRLPELDDGASIARPDAHVE